MFAFVSVISSLSPSLSLSLSPSLLSLSLSLSLPFPLSSSIIGRNFEAFKKYVLSFLYAMPFISLVNITLKVTTGGVLLGYYWDTIGMQTLKLADQYGFAI